MSHPAPSLIRYSVPAGIAIVAAAVQIGGDGLQHALEYQREPIRLGEVWRVLTGHLVHTGPVHLLMNLGALVLLAILAPAVFAPATGPLRIAVVALVTSSGLLLFDPGLDWYRGLSGVLHGIAMLVALALLSGRALPGRTLPGRTLSGQAGSGQTLAGTALLAGIIGKLLWEQYGGGTGSAALTGVPVIVDAHLWGAVGGLLVATAERMLRQRPPR